MHMTQIGNNSLKDNYKIQSLRKTVLSISIRNNYPRQIAKKKCSNISPISILYVICLLMWWLIL